MVVSDKLVVFVDSEQYEQRVAMESIEQPHYAYNNSSSKQSMANVNNSHKQCRKIKSQNVVDTYRRRLPIEEGDVNLHNR